MNLKRQSQRVRHTKPLVITQGTASLGERCVRTATRVHVDMCGRVAVRVHWGKVHRVGIQNLPAGGPPSPIPDHPASELFASKRKRCDSQVADVQVQPPLVQHWSVLLEWLQRAGVRRMQSALGFGRRGLVFHRDAVRLKHLSCGVRVAQKGAEDVSWEGGRVGKVPCESVGGRREAEVYLGWMRGCFRVQGLGSEGNACHRGRSTDLLALCVE